MYVDIMLNATYVNMPAGFFVLYHFIKKINTVSLLIKT